MKPPCLRLQASGQRAEHQLFGTRQARLGFRFAFQNAELLSKQGNLKIFFRRGNSDRCEDIQNERNEAEQQVINHALKMNPQMWRNDQH
jgi:hypothetical protein